MTTPIRKNRLIRHLATTLTVTAVPFTAHADIIASTVFTGRTVAGKTASNITWTVGGVQDPGDLTAVDEAPASGAFTALFDTPNAQGHFAPDKNTGNEGPWSVTIPLTLTVTEITISDVDLDWQHFNNSGAFQGVNRQVDWTVTVTGSTSGQTGTVTAVNVSGTSGLETLTFSSPLTLTDAETWDVKILAEGSNIDGNNTGLDAITINGRAGPDTEPPLLLTLNPADDTPKVAVSTNLVATFNEAIAPGTGNITIKECVGDAIVEVFAVTSSPNLSFDSASVTIDPGNDLGGDVGYYVEIDATAIEDTSGNAFAGIAGNATWNFTTAYLSFALAIDADTGHTYEVNVIGALNDTVIANVVPATEDGNQTTSNWTNIGPTALPALAIGQSVRLEWRFVGATSNNFNGAYVDDVLVTVD